MLLFHIENKRNSGSKGWDMHYDDAHNKICQQLTRNDQVMSWARAAELASGMLQKAEKEGADTSIWRYGVSVTLC